MRSTVKRTKFGSRFWSALSSSTVRLNSGRGDGILYRSPVYIRKRASVRLLLA